MVTPESSNRKGFTLLEVIVALVLASIAAAIFAPSVLQRTRTESVQIFAAELAELVEGIKRYHWANGQFPSNQNDIVAFLGISSWPESPIGGTLDYSTTPPLTAELSLTGVSGANRKYLRIIDRMVPFSQCDVNAGMCVIEIPASSVYVDQEIQDAAIVDPGTSLTTVFSFTCPTGMAPHYLVSVLKAEDPNGYGIAGFKAYVDANDRARLEVRSINGNTHTDPAGGKLLVLGFCH